MTFHILTKSSRTLSQQKKNESLKPFFHRNPEFDLKTFNFFDKNAVTALNWEGLEQEQISDRLQGYQRLLNLHPKSASHLARIPRKIFVAKHASLHQRATGVRNRTKHLWAPWLRHYSLTPPQMRTRRDPRSRGSPYRLGRGAETQHIHFQGMTNFEQLN